MNECSVCGSKDVKTLLDLGFSPLANSLEPTAELARAAPRFPLALILCSSCLYVRLSTLVDPSLLFRNNLYLTGVSEETRKDMEDFAADCIDTCGLTPGSATLDVASNDGTLMSALSENGLVAVGVDPSTNACAVASAKGLAVLNDFFDTPSADQIRLKFGKMSLITMTNVITHVPDPVRMLKTAEALLHPGGVIALEFYNFESMVQNTAFDQVYHEHVSYLNLHSFLSVARAAGLEVFKVRRVTSQGGSLRVFVARPSERELDASVEQVLREEGTVGAVRARYLSFQGRVLALRKKTLAHLAEEYRQHNTVVGYGASAKATVLLNYLSLSSREIRAIGDRNPLKQQKYVPGTDIPVVGPEHLAPLHPDSVLIFAWNIQREVVRSVEGLFDRPVDLMVLIPEPRKFSSKSPPHNIQALGQPLDGK